MGRGGLLSRLGLQLRAHPHRSEAVDALWEAEREDVEVREVMTKTLGHGAMLCKDEAACTE